MTSPQLDLVGLPIVQSPDAPLYRSVHHMWEVDSGSIRVRVYVFSFRWLWICIYNICCQCHFSWDSAMTSWPCDKLTVFQMLCYFVIWNTVI